MSRRESQIDHNPRDFLNGSFIKLSPDHGFMTSRALAQGFFQNDKNFLMNAANDEEDDDIDEMQLINKFKQNDMKKRGPQEGGLVINTEINAQSDDEFETGYFKPSSL